jgi:hypothetical protein
MLNRKIITNGNENPKRIGNIAVNQMWNTVVKMKKKR